MEVLYCLRALERKKSKNSTKTSLISKKLFTEEQGYHPQYFPGTRFPGMQTFLHTFIIWACAQPCCASAR